MQWARPVCRSRSRALRAPQRRSLPTAVFYPVRGVAADGGPGAQPDRTHAPYPLLVFSQGYDLSVQAYSTLLTDWASAGFVVAAPTYPHTDPSDQSGLDENDITNHPADLRYVITSLLAAAHGSGSLLSGLIDANEIGVVGHSDGADVALAVAADTCCQDPRVKAAAILSGAELASFGGRYAFSGAVPLLITQGNADTINLPACSAQIYDAAGISQVLPRPSRARRTSFPMPTRARISRSSPSVITDFFDAELAGRTAALAAMTTDGNMGGRSTLDDERGRASGRRTVPGGPELSQSAHVPFARSSACRCARSGTDSLATRCRSHRDKWGHLGQGGQVERRRVHGVCHGRLPLRVGVEVVARVIQREHRGRNTRTVVDVGHRGAQVQYGVKCARREDPPVNLLKITLLQRGPSLDLAGSAGQQA